MTRYLGVDLAWSEGTDRKPANETGLAVIDEHGTILDAGWARGIDGVEEWIVRWADPGSFVAIDAPLIVQNASGMRDCERQVGRGYGRWHVCANASNLNLRWLGGVTLFRRLAARGFRYLGDAAASDEHAPTVFECYPYTTIVGVPQLGYDEKRPRYKRPDRSLPPSLRREARAAACDELIRRVATLESADPPLRLDSHEITRTLVDEPSPQNDVAYKHREDLLDAVLSAWTASLWHRHGLDRVQLLGAASELDASGRRGMIVAPARPEQRVS
ncbi:MAG: DUF429 domain-containing protein [Salinibacterium sp.]|nr:DUF429 domain-containing protein [Salinibacterium sp.]